MKTGKVKLSEIQKLARPKSDKSKHLKDQNLKYLIKSKKLNNQNLTK